MNRASNGSVGHGNNTVTWSPWLVLSLAIPQMGINVISIFCNCLVIFSTVSPRRLHKPIFILFGSLALSDLLSSVSSFWVALLFISEPENSVYGSRELLYPYAILATSTLSTAYNLIGIGVERYLTMMPNCLRPRCRISRYQTWAMAITGWLLAALFGGLPLMGWNCLDEEATSSALYRPLCIDYLVFITIPNCVVTFVSLFFTYVSIIVILKRQKCIIAAQGHVSNRYRAAETQVTRTSVIIWVMTVVSYAPFFSGVLWDALDHSHLRDLQIHVFILRNVTAIMITLNSLVNPMVYCHRLKGLGTFVGSFKCHFSKRIHVRTVKTV
ncbi:lysophosphatidic acid receptor 3-like [Leucoraja erinacea]|uniref:lysophosphatidic acid receptor 3-like n=1 Tax=Leucoraja erinaceus TaxID=7782 RepID=UPI002454179A|nr:lysophosphatidic acid receptor 3-like [Leucoraja erinacea]